MSSEFTRSSSRIQTLQRLGVVNRRNLFWSFYEPRNFGDWIGPYLFEAITGKPPYHCHSKVEGKSRLFMSAGSTLRHIKQPDRVTVWGSGIISAVDEFKRPRRVLAVRGPRTRERLEVLGFPNTDIYGDPGILMPLFYKPDIAKTQKLGLIPHFVDYEHTKAIFGHREDLKIINVCQDVESVINDITSCEGTISSSLHGLIISHAYDVPSAWNKTVHPLAGDGVKFLDYFESGAVNGAEPLEIEATTTTSDLGRLALSSEMPALKSLQGKLFDSCPFGKWGFP